MIEKEKELQKMGNDKSKKEKRVRGRYKMFNDALLYTKRSKVFDDASNIQKERCESR